MEGFYCVSAEEEEKKEVNIRRARGLGSRCDHHDIDALSPATFRRPQNFVHSLDRSPTT